MPKNKKHKKNARGMTPHELWSRLPWKQVNQTYGIEPNNISLIYYS